MARISNIPAPRAEETFGSIAARIHARCIGTKRGVTAVDPLGIGVTNPDRILVQGLESFCRATENLGYGSPAEVQARHCLLPILQPVVDPARYRLAEARIARGRIPGLQWVLWAPGLPPIRRQRVFCRTCAYQDRSSHGFTIWKRGPQVGAVMLCASCGSPLTRACEACNRSTQSPDPACPRCVDLRPVGDQIVARRYSQFVEDIYAGRMPYTSAEARLAAVLARLERSPLQAASHLADLLRPGFGDDLSEADLGLDKPPRDGWPLIYLLGAGHLQDTCVHLAILSVLFTSLDDYVGAVGKAEGPSKRVGSNVMGRFGVCCGIRQILTLYRMGWSARELACRHDTNPGVIEEIVRLRRVGHGPRRNGEHGRPIALTG